MEITPGPNRVSISLVVPVRDESSTISTLIASIHAQTRPPDEIVFVDGGSSDNTIAQLRSAAAQDARILLIEAQEATPGRGRNIGISAATHDWIALTDAGIILEPDWLARLVDCVNADPSVQIVFGNYEPAANTMFESSAAIAYVEPPHATPAGLMRGPSVASCLLKRNLWRAVGGFPDLRATEDLIFLERVRQLSAKTIWAPQAMVWWKLKPSLGETFRRFALYSKHNVWAGRQRYWHYGIARQYALAVLVFLLALVQSRWWFLVLLLGLVARTAKMIWRNRRGHNLAWLLDPRRAVLVGVILLTLDLGTFTGWLQAMCRPNGQIALARSGES